MENKNLEEIVQVGIEESMKKKDEVRLATLRSIKSAFQVAKTAPGANKELSYDEQLKIVQKLGKQRNDSIEQYEKAGRPDLAENEKAELKIIEEFLPKQLSEDELDSIISVASKTICASSMKDMGRLMKEVNSIVAGRADGKTVANKVKQLLSR